MDVFLWAFWHDENMKSLKSSFIAASVYLFLGLSTGLYYREMTKFNSFPSDSFTQLSVLHTHFLVLGTVFFLIVMVFERLFQVSDAKPYRWFFILYNAGLALTTLMMTVNGTMVVLGYKTNAAISGIAGLGHILLTVGLILFFIAIKQTALNPKNIQTA